MRRAVLDANALYGAVPRDVLLRLAIRKLYQPIWTAQILQELEDALLRNRPQMRAVQVAHLRRALSANFPDALTAFGDADLARVPAAIDDGDRHVVAVALAAEADLIVTQNLRHFPEYALEPLGVAAASIDRFLCELLASDRLPVLATVLAIPGYYSRPPMTDVEFLDALARDAPRFVAGITESSSEHTSLNPP